MKERKEKRGENGRGEARRVTFYVDVSPTSLVQVEVGGEGREK